MGEPAELGENARANVHEWARRLIEAVREDDYISRGEIAGVAYDGDKDDLLMAALERAQVIADSVSRSKLIEKLRDEQFPDVARDSMPEHDQAVRHGWNLARRALLRELEEGKL